MSKRERWEECKICHRNLGVDGLIDGLCYRCRKGLPSRRAKAGA
jgi:hypothetical protein